MAGGAVGGIAGRMLANRLAQRIDSARIIWMSILVLGVPQVLAAAAWSGWGVLLVPLGWGIGYFSMIVYILAACD